MVGVELGEEIGGDGIGVGEERVFGVYGWGVSGVGSGWMVGNDKVEWG